MQQFPPQWQSLKIILTKIRLPLLMGIRVQYLRFSRKVTRACLEAEWHAIVIKCVKIVVYFGFLELSVLTLCVGVSLGRMVVSESSPWRHANCLLSPVTLKHTLIPQFQADLHFYCSISWLYVTVNKWFFCLPWISSQDDCRQLPSYSF